MKAGHSRLSEPARTSTDGPLGRNMHRVFCASCGRDGGLVTREVTHVLYVCRRCITQYGTPPLAAIPEEHMRR